MNKNIYENREICCNCLHELGVEVRMNRKNMDTLVCPECGCIKKSKRGC